MDLKLNRKTRKRYLNFANDNLETVIANYYKQIFIVKSFISSVEDSNVKRLTTILKTCTPDIKPGIFKSKLYKLWFRLDNNVKELLLVETVLASFYKLLKPSIKDTCDEFIEKVKLIPFKINMVEDEFNIDTIIEFEQFVMDGLVNTYIERKHVCDMLLIRESDFTDYVKARD